MMPPIREKTKASSISVLESSHPKRNITWVKMSESASTTRDHRAVCETANAVPTATVLTGDVHDNSGITIVVPAEELSKLLKSPAVQAAQDATMRGLPHRP